MVESNVTPEKRRPWHLWVMGIVALLWALLGTLDFVMTITRNEAYMENLTPELIEWAYGLPGWMMALLGLGAALGPAGAVLLLLGRKLSFPVLGAWLGTGVITSIYSFGFAEALEVMGTAALVMTLIGLTFGISLVAYSRAMTQRGVLT